MNPLLSHSLETLDSNIIIDHLIRECDDSFMPIAAVESEPHLLISKVRKHYMEYIIKLLSINYENNQKLLNKNPYIPSAIWRCAKTMEMNAAQTCMVVQLYRKNILAVIRELKNDIKQGKLNKNLYQCLVKPPENEKKIQTNFPVSNECNCQCACSQRKKRRRLSESPKRFENLGLNVAIGSNIKKEGKLLNNTPIAIIDLDTPEINTDSNLKTNLPLHIQDKVSISNKSTILSHKPTQISIESQDSDELMLQLQKLFQSNSHEDDLFEGALGDAIDNSIGYEPQPNQSVNQDCIIENHAAQIKSLDERLASLTGLLNNHEHDSISQPKVETRKCINKKRFSSKWLCEEYFLKSQLFELLDQISDTNGKKLARIKQTLANLFGDDSDEEGVISPLEETPDFVISCKERIAPWVVKILTPFYIKGRIQTKILFKALAKHLLKLIYQCSRYPNEYEVYSFVSDFLKNHKTIRCEADFKQFRIENLCLNVKEKM